MVAARGFTLAIAVASGRAAEFPAPHHERAVEEAALLEIREEPGDGLVDRRRALLHALLEIAVHVPAAHPHLHKTHAALHETAGNEQAASHFLAAAAPHATAAHARSDPGGTGTRSRHAVKLPHGQRLLREVERVGRFGLHLEGHLHAGDLGLQLAVAIKGLVVHLVEPAHEIELPALLGQAHERVAQVLDQLGDIVAGRVDTGALEPPGKKARLPVLRAAIRQIGAPQTHESGQVLVQRAQTVERPAAHAGPREAQRPGIHEDGRGLVRRNVGPQAPDHRHVIHVLAEFRKHLADLDPALPVFLEGERRAEGQPFAAGQGLAVEARQLGLRIPCVHMRRRPFQKDLDHVLRLVGKMRGQTALRLRQQTAGRRCGVGLEQPGQTEHSQPHPGAPQKIAARVHHAAGGQTGKMLGKKSGGWAHGGSRGGWFLHSTPHGHAR